MVLGAGRGPLVSAAVRASHQSARKIKVYAVEKNPNAVVTYVTSCTNIFKYLSQGSEKTRVFKKAQLTGFWGVLLGFGLYWIFWIIFV